MGSRGIVVRIHAGDQVIDWNVDEPELLSLDDVLGAIHQIVQDDSVQAFDYEDDDGDKITVRTEEEMRAMISFHLTFYEESDIMPPLDVVAKDVRSGKRNVEDLKIMCTDNVEGMETEPQLPPKSNTPKIQYSPIDTSSPGTKKLSGDVRKILEGGTLQENDVQHLKIMGSGHCGTVYKSVHKPSGHLMAVKDIPLTINARDQNEIISELEALHTCNSALIIRFYGAYFTEGKISICTEFMDGGSLDRYGRIPEQILGQIAVSIVKGLQYLWTKKIMHRDLKPSNILVNTHGRVKLCDFGVSVQLITSRTKTYIGTMCYMAPERLKGEDYRMMADVWSLGVLLFELVSGRFPYKSAFNANSSPADVINSIVQKDPPLLIPADSVSPEIVDFVSKCMTKDPKGRPEPHSLMHHPFTQQYLDRDDSIIANWVKVELAKCRA